MLLCFYIIRYNKNQECKLFYLCSLIHHCCDDVVASIADVCQRSLSADTDRWWSSVILLQCCCAFHADTKVCVTSVVIMFVVLTILYWQLLYLDIKYIYYLTLPPNWKKVLFLLYFLCLWIVDFILISFVSH